MVTFDDLEDMPMGEEDFVASERKENKVDISKLPLIMPEEDSNVVHLIFLDNERQQTTTSGQACLGTAADVALVQLLMLPSELE